MTNNTIQLKDNDKKRIKEVQSVLQKIDAKQSVFFNITLYQNMGLIRGRGEYSISPTSGKKVKTRTNWFLTDKGKRVLNTFI